jgi:hypothetical protein
VSRIEVLGWGAVGFVLLCLSLLGIVAVWAAIDYIRNNRNMGSK